MDRTLSYAIEARNAGILVIAVSVGLDANIALLGAMVTRPPEAHLFVVTSSNRLQSMVEPVVNATCNDVNECQTDPCQSGGRCVDGVCDAITTTTTITGCFRPWAFYFQMHLKNKNLIMLIGEDSRETTCLFELSVALQRKKCGLLLSTFLREYEPFAV